MAIHCTMSQLEYNSIQMAKLCCDETQVRSKLKTECELTGLPFRMMYAYARINPELAHKTNPVFNERFFKALSSEAPQLAGKTFPSDFKRIIDDMYRVSLLLKAEKATENAALRLKLKDNPELKAKMLEEKEDDKKFRMTAIVNGNEEQIAGDTIEPEGIFFGRGESPFNGYWKYNVEPEDVTLNWISPEGHEPPAAPEGHHWAAVRSAPNAHVLATYKINVGWKQHKLGFNKKVQFSANSSLKTGADKLKFQNASSLKHHYNNIMRDVNAALRGDDLEKRQTATLVWLVANTGIRIGSEKEGTEWDNGTVGASTLKVKNVSMNGNIMHLDFIGKDSVHDVRDVELEPQIAEAVSSFIANKSSEAQVFDLANEGTVNAFLGAYMKGCTAKLLRTYIANEKMESALKEETAKLGKNPSIPKLVNAFKNANLVVATQLNHQTNVAKGYEAAVDKMVDNIDATKERLEAQTKRSKAKIKQWKLMASKTDVESLKQQLKEKIAKEEALMKKRAEALEAKEFKLSQKKATKNTALGTSLNAYISPVVVKAWCDANDVPLEMVYSKALIKKYSWAF